MSVHLDPENLGKGELRSSIPSHNHKTQAVTLDAKPAIRRRLGVGAILGIFIKSGVMLPAFMMVVAVGAEHFAASEWKPSSMIGAFGGNKQSAEVLTAIEAQRALFAAQETEKARAQQLITATQAENERVTRAYQALYERANMMATTWAETAKETLALTMRSRYDGLRGQLANSYTKDRLAMGCDFFSMFDPSITCGDTLRESAYNDREAAVREITASYKRQLEEISATYAAWSQGVPDPATVVAYKASFDHLYPLPAAEPPLPPINKS